MYMAVYRYFSCTNARHITHALKTNTLPAPLRDVDYATLTHVSGAFRVRFPHDRMAKACPLHIHHSYHTRERKREKERIRKIIYFHPTNTAAQNATAVCALHTHIYAPYNNIFGVLCPVVASSPSTIARIPLPVLLNCEWHAGATTRYSCSLDVGRLPRGVAERGSVTVCARVWVGALLLLSGAGGGGDAVVCSRLQAPALHGSACENVCVSACTIWGRLGDGVGVVSCTFGEIAGQKSRQHKQQQQRPHRRTVRTFAPVAGTNMHAMFGPAANTIVGKNANKSFGRAEFNCSVCPRRC